MKLKNSCNQRGVMPAQTRSIGRAIWTIIVVVFLAAILFSSFTIVPAGHRGVVLRLGAVEDRVLGEGFHMIIPFIQTVEKMEVRTQRYDSKATAATKDLLDVNTNVAVNYHLSEKAVNKLYQEIGLDYEERVIAPAVQEVVKATTAKFDAEKLVTERASVKEQIEQSLKDRLSSRDVFVETISITDFTFPKQFNDAITDKQTAIQLKLKAENDLERIKVEAQQAVAQAEGQAQSIEVINTQLQKSPQYIQYMATQKWDGKMPLAVGSGALPFIQIPAGNQS